MDIGYFGKITPTVYAAALQLRGDDDSCWEDERVPLADPPFVFGTDFPEDAQADEVIGIWEAALAESRKEFGEDRFVLKSVTVYMMGKDPHDTALTWAKSCEVSRTVASDDIRKYEEPGESDDYLIQLCQKARGGDHRAANFLKQYAKIRGKRAVWLVPVLRQLLGNLETRDDAAFALAAIGPGAYESVPELIQAIRRDPANYVCGAFLAALEAIGPAAREAIPALIEVVTEGWCGREEGLDALNILGNFGPEGQAAIAAIEAAHEDAPQPESDDEKTNFGSDVASLLDLL